MVKHMKRGEKPLGDKYLARIQLDRDMGEIFEWVTKMKPSNRAREISVALRLGFSVQKLNGDLLLNRISNQIESLPSLDIESESQTEDAGTASINTEQRMKELGYDLDFFTPPPATPH